MDTDSELTLARNEVLRKIGRNVVGFQRMESMMKFLIANQKIEGFVDRLQKSLEENQQKINRATMGNLVNQLFETVVSSESDLQDDSAFDDRLWSVSFQVKLEADAWLDAKGSFERLVVERNRLIHQLLARFDQNSLESCLDLSGILDEQSALIEPHYEFLRQSVITVIDGRKELVDHLESEGFSAAPR